MEWDFSSLSDVSWIIPTLISLGVLIVMVVSIRVQQPQIVINIWKRSKEPESGVLWGIGGFVVGLIVGQQIKEWMEKEE